MQEPAVHQDVVEAQGTPLTGFDLDFVGDGLGHGLPPHPGEELLFDVVDEDADEHAGHGHRHHAEHHQIRSAELSAALDQESEASVGSEEFRAHKIHPAPRQRDLERAEDHRQGRGDAYGPEKLPVRRAVEPAHLEKDRIGHAHAHIGIDDARHDAADPDDEHLARQADAEPVDGQRNPRDGRDGPDEFENGAREPFGQPEPAHGQAERDADGEGHTANKGRSNKSSWG